MAGAWTMRSESRAVGRWRGVRSAGPSPGHPLLPTSSLTSHTPPQPITHNPQPTRHRRKREARQVHERSATAQKLHGFKAKLFNKKRHNEKIQMKKTIKAHEERNNTHRSGEEAGAGGAVPTYLLDREQQSRAKVLSNMIKQKRKEKAGKWQVPLPKVKGMDEADVFKVVKSGKRKSRLLHLAVRGVTWPPGQVLALRLTARSSGAGLPVWSPLVTKQYNGRAP
jgi:hypothetical protein